MAQSLVRLTLESNQYEKGLRNAQKQLDDFTKGIGISAKAFSGMAVSVAAVTGALKVAKDAFFSNEQQLDEWGRTVQASESLYQGFLNALNNTDISGFLTRMDDIVSAARDAYNALDDLNTYSAFNQRNEMKERAGYTKALDEYKLNPTAENKKALADANKAVIDGLLETQQKTEDAYMAALRQIATERLNDKKLQNEFVKVFSEGGRNALADAKIGYSQGKMLNAGAQYWYGDRVYDGRIQDRSTGKWRDMSQQERQNFEFARALSQVNDNQINEVQALGRQSQAIADQIYQQDRAYNRMAGNNRKVGGLVGGGGNTTTAPTYAEDSIAAQSALVSDLRKKWSEAGEAVRNDLLVQLIAAEDKLKAMNNQAALFRENQQGKLLGGDIQTSGLGSVTSATTISDKSIQDLANKIKDAMKDSNKSQGKEEKYAINGISQMNSGISSIVGGIESLGVEIPEGLKQGLSAVQGITNILLGISATVLAIEAIAGADAFLPFARGGVVHAAGGTVAGNAYSGDQIPAMLNAGETVLTKSQAGIIANRLSEAGGGGGYQPSHISGEQIYIAMNRYTRRTGKGEIVTWK